MMERVYMENQGDCKIQETPVMPVGEAMKDMDSLIEEILLMVNAIESHLNGCPLTDEKPTPRPVTTLRAWVGDDLERLKGIAFTLHNIDRMI